MIHAATLLLSIVAFGGGGGSGGGGGGGVGGFSGGSGASSDGSVDPFSVIIFVLFITLFIYSAIRGRAVLARRRRTIRDSILRAEYLDPVWNGENLVEYAEKIFRQYQLDWEYYDLPSMQKYMSDSYYRKNQLMVAALADIHRTNSIENINITAINITSVNDAVDNNSDRYSAEISVTANDILYDTRDNSRLYYMPSSVVETYNFVRSGDTWLLDSIDEATADAGQRNTQLQAFAQSHDFFYSLDWGRLLLPRYGSIFGEGMFKTADINNHCIGTYHNLLVQIYTYNFTRLKSYSYVIAQVTLPKSYGQIVVRHHKRVQLPVLGLQRIKTEWSDFNKKYEVYASDSELATSFELLNPAFMQRLEAYAADINIEVVDNSVYLYTPNVSSGNQQYETMFKVLEEAFKELKM